MPEPANRRRDYTTELAEILHEPRSPDEMARRIADWDGTVADGWSLATAYRNNDAQNWTALGDLLVGNEPAHARLARLWAMLALAGEQLDTALGRPGGDPVSLRWVSRLSSYRWAIRSLSDDPRAAALAAGADPRSPGWARLDFGADGPPARDVTPEEHVFLLDLLERFEVDLHKELFPVESDYFADRALAHGQLPDEPDREATYGAEPS